MARSSIFAIFLAFSVIAALFLADVDAATRAPKFSKTTKKAVNKLVNCLTPVDTVLAAKTADCQDSMCVSSAKQYAQRRYPVQYQSTVVPCMSSTTTLAPVTEKLKKTKNDKIGRGSDKMIRIQGN
ncbi:unnamed protein product [Caenorhabditis nigoni]